MSALSVRGTRLFLKKDTKLEEQEARKLISVLDFKKSSYIAVGVPHIRKKVIREDTTKFLDSDLVHSVTYIGKLKVSEYTQEMKIGLNINSDEQLLKLKDKYNKGEECLFGITHPIITEANRRFYAIVKEFEFGKAAIKGIMTCTITLVVNKCDFNIEAPKE